MEAMKTVFLLISCLVFASVVRAAEINDEDPTIIVDGNPVEADKPAEDTKKQEDELMEEKVHEDVPAAKKQEDELMEEKGEEAPAEGSDKQYLVNGEEFGPEDFDEDPSVVIDGETGDEMDEPAEDPAPWGWKKHLFSWCTIKGRQFLSGRKGVVQTFAQCAARCVKTRGCKAIELWHKYNWNCYWCKRIDLIRPYTNKRDLAYPAHVWVQIRKPPVTRPPPPVTKPTFPTHPAVNVTCGKNEMSISLPKYLLHGLDREHLRLSDINCGARETRTHYILRTKLTGCGTTMRPSKKFICYMNKVEEIPLKKNQIITRVREVEIPFSCYYSNMGVVSAIGLQVKSKKIVFSKKGFGKFVLEMKIYPTPRYSIEYKKFPVVVKLRKWLYVKVNVDSDDRRLSALAVDCWATPNSNPLSKGLRYYLIKNGCAVDKTVMFIPTRDKRMQKFKLEAFSFVGDHQFVYLHCKVMICNAANPRSRCARGCIKRGKRSLMTQGSTDEEVNMSQGPFMRGEEEGETKLEKTVKDMRKDMRDEEKSGTFPTLVAAMAVVAAVCIMGVSYFAWDKRKQKAGSDYQRLTVATED